MGSHLVVSNRAELLFVRKKELLTPRFIFFFFNHVSFGTS